MSDASFYNLYSEGCLRAAVAVPTVHLADPKANREEMLRLVQQAEAAGACLVVFPELGLTGYSLDDLFQQSALLDAAETALRDLAEATSAHAVITIVGLPLRHQHRLFNVAAVLSQGELLGLVPKSYLPNYREFYESRQFTAADALYDGEVYLEPWGNVPFGTDLLFSVSGDTDFTFGLEICEDLWVPVPPSSFQALQGAEVLINLSASPASIAKADYRRALVQQQSARCVAAYLFSGSGFGESTTDLAWDGHGLIAENGTLLSESARFSPHSQLLLGDIDLERLGQERMRLNTFGDNAKALLWGRTVRTVHVEFNTSLEHELPLLTARTRMPFVPQDPTLRHTRIKEILQIQAQGLAQRLKASGMDRLVIGVSGGLDSTLGLMVAVLAADLLGRSPDTVLAYTLPGFATSERTLKQAWALMHSLGVQAEEIDIRPAAQQRLKDLKHPYAQGEAVYDVTFENVQAGERTALLFRLANQHRALVVGTSDLSELALGWSTYGVGDHMAHYHVNASVPKTLVQHIIAWARDSGEWSPAFSEALDAVLKTDISPELIPGESKDTPQQKTEDSLGPYALHDFFLYGVLRHGYGPRKLAWLARQSWGQGPDALSDALILSTLHTFVTRFFAGSQFKRSCIANAPKVGSGGALSPRGDWRMPSDSQATVWLDELKRIPPA